MQKAWKLQVGKTYFLCCNTGNVPRRQQTSGGKKKFPPRCGNASMFQEKIRDQSCRLVWDSEYRLDSNRQQGQRWFQADKIELIASTWLAKSPPGYTRIHVTQNHENQSYCIIRLGNQSKKRSGPQNFK